MSSCWWHQQTARLTSQPTHLSSSSKCIWSPCSVWSPVVICCATVRTLISTNKFVLDTNDSFAVSGTVGYTNERQQSPHCRVRFVSTNSDKCGGRGRKTMDPLSCCWVKGGFFKGRRRREAKRHKVILGGDSFLSL